MKTCGYVKRNPVADCGRPAVVVFEYGGGVGACEKHVWPVMRFTQDGEMNGRRDMQGERAVVAVPAWLWPSYHEHGTVT